MRHQLFAILFTSIFVLAGCTKSKMQWVYYDETRCADKWEYTNNNEQLKENFTSHFKSQGVKIIEVEIFRDITADPCGECTCKTGRRFKAKVHQRDVADAKGQGCYQ